MGWCWLREGSRGLPRTGALWLGGPQTDVPGAHPRGPPLGPAPHQVGAAPADLAVLHSTGLSSPVLSSQTSWGARCSGVSRERQGAGVRLGKIAPYVNLTPASIPSVTSDICVVVGCTVCGTLEPSSPGVLQVPPRSATGGQRLRVPRERAWTPARAGGTGQPRATRLPQDTASGCPRLRAHPGVWPQLPEWAGGSPRHPLPSAPGAAGGLLRPARTALLLLH